MEFQKYSLELALDLDQYPTKWWQEQCLKYRQLHKIANIYLSVPCCLNRLHQQEANERMSLQNKRFMLRQWNAIEKRLWYLKYNKNSRQLLTNLVEYPTSSQ